MADPVHSARLSSRPTRGASPFKVRMCLLVADRNQPNSAQPLSTATLPFGVLTLASVIAILLAPEVESGRIFPTADVPSLHPLIKRAVENESQEDSEKSLNLIASGVLGYLAGSALMGLRT